jgi:PAP2 superfamily
VRTNGARNLWLLAIFSMVFALQCAHADVVTEWNVTAIDASAQTNSLVQSRALAITHAAVFDAVNAIGGKYKPYLAEIKAPVGASQEAAAAVAAHAVLSWLFPAQKGMLDGALTSALAKVSDGAAKEDGVAVGKQAAEKYVATRGEDGYTRKMDYTPSHGPGKWQPTPPAQAPMVMPQWAGVTPFVLTSPTELGVKGPPALDSAEFAKDVDEVRRLGARNSKERTADQTAAAIFWVINPTVPWNAAARATAVAKGTSVIENARIFALMNMAGADAYIASWAIKKQYGFWRPVTAIRTAAQNPDPTWEPLLNTPAHPDYVSGHCIYSGAVARTLRQLFGDDGAKFSATFGGPNGVTRSYPGFAEAEKEVEEARVWGGIHFRTADEHGTALGHQIADLAVQRHMRPVG